MKQYLSWRQFGLRDENGILVGSDISQEWLLPWWWKRYSGHNQYPVAFIDFGMSADKKKWCQERGELIPLQLSADFIFQKEEMNPKTVEELETKYEESFWESRSAWFKKPFALLQTPFNKTIWLDLDCEVRGSLEPLFAYAEPLSLLKETEIIYNSGVIPYEKDLDLIIDWAKACIEGNKTFRGDQEVLSHLIKEKNISIRHLPKEYNWSREKPESDSMLIYHLHDAVGKSVIRHQLWLEELLF